MLLCASVRRGFIFVVHPGIRGVETFSACNIIGEIVNVSADECVLGEDGLIDAAKLRAIAYDAVHNDYLVLGEKVGNAFKDGNKLK